LPPIKHDIHDLKFIFIYFFSGKQKATMSRKLTKNAQRPFVMRTAAIPGHFLKRRINYFKRSIMFMSGEYEDLSALLRSFGFSEEEELNSVFDEVKNFR